MFPDASIFGARASRRAMLTQRRTVSGVWLSIRSTSAPPPTASRKSSSDSTSTSIVIPAGTRALAASRADRTPAAIAHGDPIESAQARRRLSRVQDPATGAGHRLDVTTRRARDPAHALQEVQCDPLSGQDRACLAGETREGRRGDDLPSGPHALLPGKRIIEELEDPPGDREAGDDAL